MVDISGLDLTNVFKLVNLAVGILAVLGGISQFFPVSFQSTIIAIYVILFGVGITFLELVQVPHATSRYASFLFSFIGRGVFYIFIGTILLHDHVLRIIAGSIIAVIGLVYVALEFVPAIQVPENMRLNDYDDATETI
ncbi:similar to Saccharomyces cerevisiae YDR100W TVP15 Integral membrane protein localized to late Golgi vesicles along with the v-SNARE Tlg2p [Geotrichum candidum]|uniref:Similar to Saccharomyces cerevisiae YDR100W TVP15 Integral membrane protein localized to late Golgi vesicles along with the v-SNARE Tlg2p n=1 Tax=Geotrichum candidum TaxID=1173061 RepID=A0A0J9XA98_GEOCN|nr:similar to Saccharomyces cerevisiae YDR100W TVP15 Integral membrane protein localized to late Golgi vesicles along with the v-SNARE Tlg2p [Geotrichum candidum]